MRMRTPLIAANWKMNKSVSDSIRYVTELKNFISGKQNLDIVLIPPYTALYSLDIALDSTSFALGAQNMSEYPYGAYTGEIAPSMLVDLNCRYVLLGHSERRQLYHETDELINHKVHIALEYGLQPIVCLGENLEDREKDNTHEVLEAQLQVAVRGVNEELVSDLVIAYEPVWAIGTGKNASPSQAQDAHTFIREKLGFMFRKDLAQRIRIIYGGSVNEKNIGLLMKQSEIDGTLVGSASLEPNQFAKIISYGE